MTLRRMKTELVKTGKRNQTCRRLGTINCRWQMYSPSPLVMMLPARRTSNVRVGLKKVFYRGQRAGQVLLVTVQIGEDIAGGAPVAAIHGVVHAVVFFDERLDTRIVREPFLSAIIRA